MMGLADEFSAEEYTVDRQAGERDEEMTDVERTPRERADHFDRLVQACTSVADGSSGEKILEEVPELGADPEEDMLEGDG
jgi:hypothetical protein